MENPKISVIVAVYKAEAYLHRCVDSLLAQTFQDFEILLIDDGSPDNSGKICDDYAKQDARIRVFHKENGGVGSARQCGIDHARGEYTTHVDSDDWVEPTMLEEMYAKAKEDDADIVLNNLCFEYRMKTKYEKQKFSSLHAKDILLGMVQYKVMPSLCSRFVRLACYRKNGIVFPEHLKIGEDYCVFVKLVCAVDKISYLPRAYYHYDCFSNSNSLTRTNRGASIVFMSEAIWNYCKDDLYRLDPQIYDVRLAMMAYDFFVDNLLSASEFHEKYGNKLSVFLRVPISLKVKFFIALSALGYKDIAYKIYRPLKRLSDNLFRKRKYGLS